jgi:C-terminal peptidase prc
VNWEAIRDEFRPLALDAASPAEFYMYLAQMIDRLGDGHSRFISPQDAYDEQALVSGTQAYVGIGVDVSPQADAGVVQTVFAGSPAEQAGIRRRDRILMIDGQPYSSGADGLRGLAGSSVHLRIQSPGTQPRELMVERREVAAKRQVEAYRLAGMDVGYVLIQSFFPEDAGDQTEAGLERLLDQGPLTGLIVDLRGNGGGWRHVLEAVLANFVEGQVGEFFRQDTSHPLDIAPNDLYSRLRDVPLVVLVDYRTESYAELFAAALQAAGRAKVVGTRTPGNTETIFPYNFDDKSRLWLAQEGFRLPAGDVLEGQGVAVDALIELDWTAFSEAEDPHILKALELLEPPPAAE